MVKTGFFAGLSVLAIVAAMDMTNAGLYASLMQEYGTKKKPVLLYLSRLSPAPDDDDYSGVRRAGNVRT